MQNHKARLDKIAAQLPSDKEDILVIRLAWPGEPWQAPIVLSRDASGQILKRVDLDGEPIQLQWGDE